GADKCYQALVTELAQQKEVSEDQIKTLEDQIKTLAMLVTQANSEKQQFSEEACKWKNEAISRQKRLDEMDRAAQDNVPREQHSQMLNELYTLALSVTDKIYIKMAESDLMMKSELTSLSPTVPESGMDGTSWPHPGDQSSVSSNPTSTENSSSLLSMLHSQSPISIDPGLIMH
ncbi:unnamed protein product, partial [Penicillium pancosmium]